MNRAVTAFVIAAGILLTAAVPAAATPTPAPEPTASATPTPSPTPTGDPVRAKEYWLTNSGITEAWKTSRGKGVTIAIIDTGVARVPELDGAVVGGTDVSGSGEPDGRTPVGVVDGNHGSWVASLAGARGTGPRAGMIGVAPEAEILSISVGFGASSKVPFVDQIAEAVRWAVDHDADIINMSLTTNQLTWDESWDDAFLYAFEHDVVIVVAAGNRGSGTSQVGAPATIPGVLTVGGVDPSGKASLSASTQGISIGVSAPSEKLLGISADGKIVTWDGTSGAAPIVAGIAALVRSAYPDLDAANVINRIIKTATPAAGAKERPDPIYGYGLVNADAAVNAEVPAVKENPMGSLKEWIRVYRRAEATATPAPDAPPVAQIEPLPEADGPTRERNPLLPSPETLRNGTIPLVAVTLPGILVALGVTAAARRIRSARASRTPSK